MIRPQLSLHIKTDRLQIALFHPTSMGLRVWCGSLPESVQEPPTPAHMNRQTPDAMPATPQPLRPIDAFLDASSSAGGGAGAELPADTVVGSQAMAWWGSCRPVVSPGQRVADGLEWEATPPPPRTIAQPRSGGGAGGAGGPRPTGQPEPRDPAGHPGQRHPPRERCTAEGEGGGGTRVRCTDPRMTTGRLL